MKKAIFVFALAALLAACSKNPQAAPLKAEAAPEGNQATVWTDKGELYLEYPPLVANQKVRFAVHLTRFSDFHALKEGACEIHLDHNGGSAEVFPCDPSTHPGIFGANVEPKQAGDASMNIQVSGRDLTERFDVGAVKIAANAQSIEPAAEKPKETIAFLKEQQWSLDFGTQIAEEGGIRDSLRVAAETLPRTGGEAAVIAPIAGRVIAQSVRVGTPVVQGASLGQHRAADHLGVGSGDSPVGRGRSQGESRPRAEGSTKSRAPTAAGAIPARRVDEARASEITTQARLDASRTRLAQYDATRTADGVETGVRRFMVRAPISGILSESNAVTGANVEDGKVLFRIIDIDSLYVGAIVPESELARLRQLSGAEIELPNGTAVHAAQKLVSIGKLVDPATRSVSVVYEVDNRDHQLAVNQTVFVRLLLAPSEKTPVVPESAIVDDAGRPIVFVQRAGETFVRKPVKLGLRSAGTVQVLEGVNAGERVVTKGAYLIRLATMSSQIPAHGHVH